MMKHIGMAAGLALALSLTGAPNWALAASAQPNQLALGKKLLAATFNAPDLGHSAALADPAEHPGNTMETYGGEVQWPGAVAKYVAEQIAKAKAEGKDTSLAEAHYRLAINWIRMGQNLNAAHHFDTALRALGIRPQVPGQNVGEVMGVHQPEG
ncbi:MAG TPA: hypothetical protein VKV28_16155 [Candidatus Binataceae bacterium]|nr:hypothetical protein [Candidatus Binataceae bacterium]